jgi:hypothetical protein
VESGEWSGEWRVEWSEVEKGRRGRGYLLSAARRLGPKRTSDCGEGAITITITVAASGSLGAAQPRRPLSLSTHTRRLHRHVHRHVLMPTHRHGLPSRPNRHLRFAIVTDTMTKTRPVT